MTARRRARRHPALLAAGLALGVVVGLAVLHMLGWLLVTAGLAAGAYAIGRNRRPVVRATTTRTGPAPVHGVTPAATSSNSTSWTGGPVAAQIATIADLRRQIAKLEDDAAAHDELLERLEAVTGRPVEAVIASYQHAQRIYGPAATGNSTRRAS
jgi:hypothetical protein